jgi:hypothetical protein
MAIDLIVGIALVIGQEDTLSIIFEFLLPVPRQVRHDFHSRFHADCKLHGE